MRYLEARTLTVIRKFEAKMRFMKQWEGMM